MQQRVSLFFCQQKHVHGGFSVTKGTCDLESGFWIDSPTKYLKQIRLMIGPDDSEPICSGSLPSWRPASQIQVSWFMVIVSSYRCRLGLENFPSDPLFSLFKFRYLSNCHVPFLLSRKFSCLRWLIDTSSIFPFVFRRYVQYCSLSVCRAHYKFLDDARKSAREIPSRLSHWLFDNMKFFEENNLKALTINPKVTCERKRN